MNFYWRFIKDFSHHARPLCELTKKDVKWTWREAKQEVFNKLKTLITTAPILILPSDDMEFQVEVDSSEFATGATLSQLSPEDGKWHPVAFLSKSLNSVERNY